jgi:hypothetical protein
MRITYEKSGGFAGLRPARKAIDTAQLSPDDATELRRLLDAARFFDLPAKIDQPQMRDAFQYNISVDTGTQQHTVSITGEPQNPALKELRRKLEKIET